MLKDGPDFVVWRALTIGGISKDELFERFAGARCNVSEQARDIIFQPAFAILPEPTEIQLAKVKVRDLGFTKMPTITGLSTRIREIGELCPAEAGPRLRLANRDQPEGTYYWVAMEPIISSYGIPLAFFVLRDDVGRLWLFTYHTYLGYTWHLESEIVFRLRNPA